MIAPLLLIATAAAAAPQAKTAHPATHAAPAKSAATKTAKPADAGPQPTVVKMSQAGQDIIRKYIGQPDPEFASLKAQLVENGEKVAHLGDAPQFDMAALEQLLRKQEEISGAMKKRSDDRLLAMLGEMSPEDRLVFSRANVAPASKPKAVAPR